MSTKKSVSPSGVSYNLQYGTTRKLRDSPTSSILKAPTPIFLTSRRSLVRTRRLKFANGLSGDQSELNVDIREGSYDSVSTSSTGEISDSKINEHSGSEEKFIEVNLTPTEKMKVSPESWKAFLEYQKYEDHSNETEKTDYTYSDLSKFRDREIIPGFRLRPNLSRRPIRPNMSYSFSTTTFSPDINHVVKRTIFRNNSTGKLKSESTTSDSELYQSKLSEYSRNDDYSHSETLRCDDKYGYCTGYGDDGKVLRRDDSFGFSTFSVDRKSHLGSPWSFDETDDEGITSTSREVKSSRYSLGWGMNPAIFLMTIYMTIFNGISSMFASFKDLFSKYIYSRNAYPTYSASATWRPWSQENTYYSYGNYNRPTNRNWSKWWYESFLYALYSKIMSPISSSSQYVRTQYYRSSKRGKILWFLIPLLLLLLAFWLFRAEGEDAYVTNKITALKCKAKQYISPVRNQINTAWYKIAPFGESIFGESLEPLRLVMRSLISLITTGFSWATSLFIGLIRGVFSVIYFLHEILSNLATIFADTFADAVEKKNNISGAMYDFFTEIIFGILSSVSSVVGGAFGLLGSAFDFFKNLFFISSGKGDANVPRLSIEIPQKDLPSGAELDILKKMAGDLNILVKRIEDLEIKFGKMKEQRNDVSLAHQKQLEDNYKALQKYQLMVNEALRRQSTKPVQLSKTSVQYYLDKVSDELKKWILAHFVLKADTVGLDENQFAVLLAKYSNGSEKELKTLQDEFSRFVRQYSDDLSSLKSNLYVSQHNDFSGSDTSLSVIKRIVADEIKLHDADKTGKVDFALQSAGGQVLGVKCTKNYNYCLRYNDVFGIQICSQLRLNVPEEAINPGMAPGQCWAFAGSQGFLVLELSHTIIVTGFTMEHISRLLSPSGRIDSAPKKFSMWGLKSEEDMEPYFFGDYEYKVSNDTYQYFPVINYTNEPYKIVELNIASNHGNPNYTCLYRIRVHGEIYSSPLKDST